MKKKTIELETDRLILRKFEITDASDIFKNYASREIVTKYLKWHPHKTIEATEDYLSKVVLPKYEEEYSYTWAIVLKETQEVIGCIDVVSKDLNAKKCTLGWVLSDNHWCKGLMTEAAKKVVEFLFDEGFVRIQSHHQIKNIASGKVMQKIGMNYEGILKKYDLDKFGELQDMKIYSIVQKL